MKLGIDFGSAYSTISRYIAAENRVEALTLKEGDSATIPSAVSVSRAGEVMCGTSAKNKVGRKNVKVYEKFKMLLVETDEQIISNSGYNQDFTPYDAAKAFLESVLCGVMNRYAGKNEEIEELVFCVPEVWSSQARTLDGRNLLKDIVQKIKLPNQKSTPHIRIYTEPEAASAFFAYNYEIETGEQFNGYLLLIDYGGGTLDITLTSITSDGEQRMEIRNCESGGVGENHPNSNGNYFIGNAGIAYINKVVELAILDSEELDEPPIFDSIDYIKAMQELEDALKDSSKIKNIKFVFDELGDYDDYESILDEKPKTFCEIEYMDETINVTYQHLFLAYQAIVAGVIEDQLGNINKKIVKNIGLDLCELDASLRNDFKIAVVGGFGTFHLVQKQIAHIYNLQLQNDLRIKNINLDKCEQAISLGAALLAADCVKIQKRARYSIGLCSNRVGNQELLCYGIKYHQEIEIGKPYFMLRKGEIEDIPVNRVTYSGLRRNIKKFIVGFSERLDRGFPMILKPEFLQRLEAVPAEGLWCLGFSMDENEVISFHVVSARTTLQNDMQNDNREIIIPLDSYANMFELTAGQEEEYANEV